MYSALQPPPLDPSGSNKHLGHWLAVIEHKFFMETTHLFNVTTSVVKSHLTILFSLFMTNFA